MAVMPAESSFHSEVYSSHQVDRGSISSRSIEEGWSSKTRRSTYQQPQRLRTSNGTVGTDYSSSTADCSMGTNITTPPKYSKKIVVVGDGGCGKTCLLISYSKGVFPEKYVPTVFENYITEKLHRRSGETVELALWDTAGQEEYDRLRPLSYPETDLLLVCFAIDCPSSLDNVLEKWYPEVTHFCPTTPLVLVGLKSDLRHKRNCIDLLRTQGLTPVTTEQGQKVAEKIHAVYRECSSKEQDGVEDLFEYAIDTAVQADIMEEQDRNTSRTSGRTKSSRRTKKRSCKLL